MPVQAPQEPDAPGSDQATQRNVLLAILSLAVAIPVLNAAAFAVYRNGHPDGKFWTQLWEYLDSDPFNVITISLLLALLAAMVDKFFDLRGVIQERVAAEQKARRDEVAAEQKARRDERAACVQQTIQMWNDLGVLTARVRFFQPDGQAADVLTLLRDLEAFSTGGERVINEWNRVFPEIARRLEPVRHAANMQLDASLTVAWALHRKAPAAETQRMQSALDVVQSGIGSLVHQNLLSALKEACRAADERLPPAEAAAAAKARDTFLGMLQTTWQFLAGLDREESLLATVPGEKARAADKAANDLVYGGGSGQPITQRPGFVQFGAALKPLSIDELVQAVTIPYTAGHLDRLARTMATLALVQELEARAAPLAD